jgi:hypothetical protein
MPLGGAGWHRGQAVGVGVAVLCGLPWVVPDFPCVAVTVALAEPVGVAVADGVDPAEVDGLADVLADGGDVVPVAGDPGWPGAVPPVPPPPSPEAGTPLTVAWPRGTVPACCGSCLTAAGGPAHCVNGACGPPVIATTTATRHAAIAAMKPKPANRRI